MPDRSRRCVIHARVEPVVPAPAFTSLLCSADAGPVIDHGEHSRNDRLRFSTIHHAIPQCRIATPHKSGLLVFGRIQWRSMAFGGSRWWVKTSCAREGGVPEPSRTFLNLPEAVSQTCDPRDLRTPTSYHLFASVRGSQSPQVGVACPGVATVFASNLGDSQRSGLRPCQCRTAPSPTCGLRTLPSSFASPPAPCVGGAMKARARISSRTETPSGIAVMTWIPGHRRSGDLAPGICRCGGTPMPESTAAPMKKRRGSDTSARALHTAHSLLREASVTPTLARRPPLRDVIPHTSAHTSHLISPGSVTK